MSDHDPHSSDLAVVMRAALDAATALARIGSHEAECARRYADMAVSISRFHSRMDQLLTTHEQERDEEMERREQRDRDTRQTRNSARVAALAAAMSFASTIAVLVIQHYWKVGP
jgi:hypothetical protein